VARSSMPYWWPGSGTGRSSPGSMPRPLHDGVDLVAIRPVEIVGVAHDPSARIPRQAPQVEHGRAHAEGKMLGRERVGRHRRGFLLQAGAVKPELVEGGGQGVVTQAPRCQVPPDVLGKITGDQRDGLLVDVPHPAQGEHGGAELGPVAVEEVGHGRALEIEQTYRGVGHDATRVVEDRGYLPGGCGSYDLVAGERAAAAPTHDTALGRQARQGATYGRSGHSVLSYERGLTRQRLSRRDVALGEGLRQDGIDLQITCYANPGVCCSRHNDEPPFHG